MLLADMNDAEKQELEDYIFTVSGGLETTLDEILPKPSEDEESRLFEAMRYCLFAGGKRLRPTLVMATNDIFGGKKELAMRVACAMESLHSYSLIHDDLPCMDDDDLRRGKPTCHIEFDEATAVLTGDALLTLAFEILADDKTHGNPRVRSDLVKLFASSAGALGMVGGQMIDILAESHAGELNQGALARLQRKKTGALFSASCEASILLNSAGREDYHRLVSYARNVGMAFQMIDDILDVVGDEKKMGKRARKDSGKGKATFASLLGVEGAKRQAEFLCGQAVDYLRPYGERARILELLARFVVTRCH